MEHISNASFLNRLSPYEQRAIHRELTNSKFDSSPDFNCEEGIRVQIDPDILEVKESSSEGNPSVVFQYENGMQSILNNFSFRDLEPELRQKINAHTNNQFSHVPSIKILGLNEAQKNYKKMMLNIKDEWPEVAEPNTKEEIAKNIDPTDWNAPKRTIQDRWNTRIRDTNDLWDKKYYPQKNTEHAFYMVNDIPVGRLSIRVGTINKLGDDQRNYICVLVTHPGSEGAGGSLLEYAVNRFIELRGGEIMPLYLYYTSEDSRHAYKKMGFVDDPSGESELMTLDLTTQPDIWSKDEFGHWGLKKLKEKRYLTSYS